ncbi:HPF/RaiA family ribosome-associated protein [Paraburkholderia aromaticivorans]|uniref:HPF/RaiA family ribosome-associated protein n=1 Tax=Paraburkholderia aromaticivorans TaxID=2026199 RepID=UPI0014561141|nr:HPF/RaiA family ribosome-associated protein [Paraburkholderia aromaticivorans]
MGVGMQIVYLGFAGTSQIEAEAASQLVRLERFSKSISGCHLAIESIRAAPERFGADGLAGDRRSLVFDARLDLIMRNGELVPIGHCLDPDAKAAIHAAFDSAEQQLERNSARTRS